MSLAVLNETERRTLDAYVALLRARLGEDLVSVRVYQLGSQFRTPEQLAASPTREVVERDGIELDLP